MTEGRCWLHVEASCLLGLERHRPRRKLRVHGLWEALRAHGVVLLGGDGIIVDGWGHWPHGRLHVVLGSKPHGALLAWRTVIERGPALMGHIISGSRLDGALIAHGSGPIKSHRAHLVRRAVEAQWPLLLEAHVVLITSRSVKSLHGALKVTRAGSIKPHWGLLTNRTIKPPGAVKPPHTVATSHWAVRHVGSIKPLRHVVMRCPTAIEPARALVVRPLKPGRVIEAPRTTTTFEPPWRVWSGGAHVPWPIVSGWGVSSVMRRRVSWGLAVLPDGG